MNTSFLVGAVLLAGALLDVAVIVLLVAPRAQTGPQKLAVLLAGTLGALVMAGLGAAFLAGWIPVG